MIPGSIRRWFKSKWGSSPPDLAKAYFIAFSTDPGQRVLRHLLDHVYCTVYEGVDPQAALVHNARRSVVQEILMNIDAGENPDKYLVHMEESDAFGRSTVIPTP